MSARRHPADPALIWDGERAIGREHVLRHAAFLAGAIEARSAAPIMNLCEDRYAFMLAFSAALLLGRHTVLPPSPLAKAQQEVQQQCGATLCIDDAWVAERLRDGAVPPGAPPPSLPERSFTAVTLFTSGSTGERRAHSRSWQQLTCGAALLQEALGLDQAPPHHLLASVPPQHLFGLEATILLPLLGGQCVAHSQPLLPEDIRVALAAMPRPRGLVTTPYHLQICLQDAAPWPPVDRVLSATAPLPQAVAGEAEARLGAVVHEVYGSTETGALALRQSARETLWRPLPGVVLESQDGRWHASGHHFPPCVLTDQLRRAADGRLEWLGRDADMVKIAGKRHSLAALTTLLQSAPGVVDAVMLPPQPGFSEQRLIALVVAPQTRVEELRRWLRARVDPLFVPRPLLLVDALPRSANGKLPKAAVHSLLSQLCHRIER